MKDAVVEVKDKQITVKVYENTAEALKTLGEGQLLTLINGAVIAKERGKHHREGQQDAAAERRKIQKAAVEFAMKNGFKKESVAKAK